MPKVTNEFSRYTKADATYKHRIVAASFGEVGTGKTEFWLGAPGPIVVQSLDQGLEGVVQKYANDKEIYLAEYDLGITPGDPFTHEKAKDARNKFVEDFEHALTVARTIVWDRESDMWPLFSYAEFGTPEMFGAAGGRDWEKLKGDIRRLIAMAKASDVNFGIIQGMKNEWAPTISRKTGKKTAESTGQRIRSGMDDIDALVHINIEHTRVNGQFGITVGKSRGPGSRDVQDQSFTDVDFITLAQMIFPDSDESDWV